MKRPWMDLPAALELETPLGKIKVKPINGTCVYVDANENCGGDPSIGLTVRGVRYGVTAHLERPESNVYGPLDFKRNRHGVVEYLYASRADWTSFTRSGSRDLSASARKTIETTILTAVQKWGDTSAAREAFKLAAHADANNRLASVEEKINEKRVELAALEGEAAALRAVLGEHAAAPENFVQNELDAHAKHDG